MQKKLFVSAGVIVMLAVFHACTLPEAIEIRGKPEISLPVNPDNANLSDMLLKNIKSSLEGVEGIDVLHFTDRDIQTFLIRYNILSDEEIKFAQDLEVLTEPKLDLDEDDLSKEIELGDLGDLNKEMEPIEIELDITKIIADAEKEINNNFNSYTTNDVVIGLKKNVEEQSYEPIDLGDFDTVTFTDAVLQIELFFDDSSPSLPGADITFTEIWITDGETPPILGTGKDNETTIRLAEDNPREIVSFNLKDKTFKSSILVTIKNWDDTNSSGDPRDIKLNADTKIISTESDRPIIRGITGFEIETTLISIEEYPFPLDLGDSGFIHAKIDDGNLSFDFELPPENSGDFKVGGFKSWASGFKFEPDLNISQEDSDLHGSTWEGLNGAGAWEVTASPSNLAGKHINTEDIYILDTSTITVSTKNPADKCSFMLSDNDLDNQSITVTVKPSMQIDKFTVVHIDAGDFVTKPDTISISLGNAADYLKSIEFKKVGVEIQFGQVDIEGLEILISEPNLKINSSPSVYQDIPANSGGPSTVSFIRENFSLPEIGGVIPLELNFEFDIRLKGDATNKVIALTDFDPSQDTLKFEVIKVKPALEWTRAVIGRMTAVEDEYPKTHSIDMSSIGETLSGFIFQNAEAYLYTSGPGAFFNLEPKMLLKAVNGDDDPGQNLLDDKGTELKKADLNGFSLDTVTGNYAGALPGNEIQLEDFGEVLSSFPKDLKFKYEVVLEEITITPEQLENDPLDSDTLSMFLLAVIPLDLKAGEGGAKFPFPEMFKDKKDLFDRKTGDDTSLLDSIKSLRLKLELTHDVFNGGTLSLENPGHTIGFPLNGKTLDLPFSPADLEYINKKENFPYKPEIGIEFVKDATLRIPQHLGVRRLEFSADLQHRIEM
jgi:hypothetical protein